MKKAHDAEARRQPKAKEREQKGRLAEERRLEKITERVQESFLYVNRGSSVIEIGSRKK